MPAQAPVIQVFGRTDSRATQKALRFFRERRVPLAFFDVARKPPAPAELRRFSQRLGASALLDPDSARYRELGLAYLRMDDSEIFDRLVVEPRLLRLPLVRHGADVTAGVAESTWKGWLGSAPR